MFLSYHVECLSYSTRAKGMIVWGVVNKIISIFNAYVNSIALSRIGWKVSPTLRPCALAPSPASC